MIKLSELLRGLPVSLNEDIEIKAITNDSRQIVSRCLFLAEQGIRSHGLDHIDGHHCDLAAAIVYQPPYHVEKFAKYHPKFFALANLNQQISEIARRFYRPPFANNLIGVTGTNGKTSVTHFIAQLSGYGVIGTMGYGRGKNLTALSQTTPDAVHSQKILATLLCQYPGVAMEVSSHALCLHRLGAVPFSVGVFTNLTQDHLDFHGDMSAYYLAKAQLFAYESVKVAVINVDDAWGYRLAKQCLARGQRVLAFGKRAGSKAFTEYVTIGETRFSATGSQCHLSIHLKDHVLTKVLDIPIWGGFNIANVLAALLALYATGHHWVDLLDKVKKLHGVRGRIEPIDLGQGKTAIIDYSHTPDALKNILSSLRAHTDNLIYVVFGCGGDRDKSKRPRMAEAVSQGADFTIVTDDNPRTENSAAIIKEILSGDIDRERFDVLPSRSVAIYSALSALKPGDTVLIAGKGHEDYQIIGTEKRPFSDHGIVNDWLSEQAS